MHPVVEERGGAGAVALALGLPVRETKGPRPYSGVANATSSWLLPEPVAISTN